MQNWNKRNRKRKKEKRVGYKELNGAEYIWRNRDYKSFIYFSIFVKNIIFYECFQFGMEKFILIYTIKDFFEFVRF